MKWKQLFGFGGFVQTESILAVEHGVPTPSLALSEAALEEVYPRLLTRVRAGYDEPASLLETATEDLQEACEEASAPECEAAAAQLLQRAMQEFSVERAAFPERTDNDKLDASFEALERAGIVARQNFTCCQTCGHAEIGDEFAVLQASVEQVRGYVFFHMQDTDSAVEGHGLHLAYGSVDGDHSQDEAIAAEVCAALRTAGLTPEWSGSHTKRINVPMTWQRRPAGAG